MTQIIAKHNGGMSFNSIIEGHSIKIDADAAFGGEDLGPTPKPLMLVSLAGCTGMDVVSLLKKMRVEYSDFEIKVDGHLTDEHPKYYDKIHITYSLKTKKIFHDKIAKSVTLSQERYCGVSYMLSKSSTLTHSIEFSEL